MKRRTFVSSLCLIAAAMLAGQVPQAEVQAQDVGVFYKDKIVSVMVGYPPGGAYDVYARLIANYMPKHLPGAPTMIVKNRPGAGSMILVNELYKVAPQDGTVFGTFARTVAIDQILGRQGANFVPREMNWIGTPVNEVSTCVVWHALGIKTIQDMMQRPLVFGAIAPGSGTDVYPAILRNLLGANFKIVTGYPGANDLTIAMERGEIDARCGWTWSAMKATRADWITDKKVYIALQFSTKKHPDMPDVPLVTDLARNETERQALDLILVSSTMGRPFAAPPKVPADRVRALRRAFDAVMADPGFLVESEKQGLEVLPMTGEEIQALVESMSKASPQAIEAARQAINPPGAAAPSEK